MRPDGGRGAPDRAHSRSAAAASGVFAITVPRFSFRAGDGCAGPRFAGATQLPLVVAITTVAQQTGHMRSSTAAALVGAAILSTLAFPLVGLRLRGDRPTAGEAWLDGDGLAPSPQPA